MNSLYKQPHIHNNPISYSLYIFSDYYNCKFMDDK